MISGEGAFVTANDIIDGNIHSLSNNFIYSGKQNRCVSIHSAVVVEALRKLYDADELADELGN